jgi:hypothetical protein
MGPLASDLNPFSGCGCTAQPKQILPVGDAVSIFISFVEQLFILIFYIYFTPKK